MSLGADETVVDLLGKDDLPSLFDLYRKVMTFPPSESVEEYWHWRFWQNPIDHGIRPPFWVVKHESRVVGAMAQVPVILEVEGHPIRSYWTADLMVDPEVRGLGLAKRIFNQYREANDIVLSTGYPPDSVTSRVARSVGFRSFPAFSYLFKFYNLKPILARLPWASPVAGCLSELSRPFLGKIGWRWRTAPAGILLREISRFDHAFDILWRRVAGEISVAVRRTHETMNWRYFDNPFFEYKTIGAWYHEELLGCVVLKVAHAETFTYGTIPEIIVPKGESAIQECLLGCAMEAFHRAKVDVVKSLMSPPHLERLLRRAGFIAIGRSIDFVFSFRPDIPDTNFASLLKRGGWYFTKGDSDLDIVPDFMQQVVR